MRVTKLLAALCFCALCSCSDVEHFQSSKLPSDEELSSAYRQTRLTVSSSADVLAVIHRPEYGTLSQSKSVIASLGQEKKGHKIWCNIVAFDEDELTAKRKCFFVVDEKEKNWFLWPKRRLVLDIEMVVEKEVLDEPYANENARRIAILRRVLENILNDIDKVTPDNKMLGICGTLINQTLGTVLQKLDESPVLTSELSSYDGFGFDHITLGKGNITMNVTGDIVEVSVRIGSLVWTFEDPFALEE